MKSFTEMEMALMEGGHSTESLEKPFSFINSLYEEGLLEKTKKDDKESDKKDDKKDDKKESKPSLVPASMAYYTFVVGKENAAKAKRFVELARDGQSIPSSVVKAYEPAIEMLNDIVRAGPGYIDQLKQVHKRAKNRRK